MSKPDAFRDLVLTQLAALPELRCRAMFGGHGLYTRGRFFAILYKGRLYLKTTAAMREPFVARGMGPFRPNRKQTLHAYYEVPRDVVEDGAELIVRARRVLSEDRPRTF